MHPILLLLRDCIKMLLYVIESTVSLGNISKLSVINRQFIVRFCIINFSKSDSIHFYIRAMDLMAPLFLFFYLNFLSKIHYSLTKINFIYREFDHLSVIHYTVQGFYYFSKHHNHNILILCLVIRYPRHSLDKISQK